MDHVLAVQLPGSMPFDFHSLRTTAATLFQGGGMPLAFVDRILNQRALAATAGNYTQPSADTRNNVVGGATPLQTGTGSVSG